LAIAAVCVASLVVCCGLAYWQWERFSEAGGTFQNLGYVFQWPLFGLFPAFMVWRIRRLDARRKAEDAEGTPDAAVAAAPEPVAVPSRPVVTVEPVRAPVRDDEDEELAAYNRMLAELHARDQR
jgi:DNA-binding transcriptional regulator of glucitol operon